MARYRHPHLVRRVSGAVTARVLPRCRFENLIVLIGHMRCGSTALSNILCSRPDISGQGESHVAYRSRGDLGVLALSLATRKVLKRSAPLLFDKILHSDYDHDADPAFSRARAIFLVREPAASIVSVRKLFERIGSKRFRSDAEAAAYYLERVTAMGRLWSAFPPDRRIALTYEALIDRPDAWLSTISERLAIFPPLENRYDPLGTPWRKGGGDPVNANRFSRIEPSLVDTAAAAPDVDAGTLDRCQRAFAQFVTLSSAAPCPGNFQQP